MQPHEERSFAPRQGRAGGRSMKVDPVPEGDDITPQQIARGMNQLHACFEDEKKKASRREKTAASHRSDMNKRMRELMARQADIYEALLGDPKAPKRAPPKLGTMTSFQAGWRIATATGGGLAGAFVLYRLVVALWPYLWGALKALNAAILA